MATTDMSELSEAGEHQSLQFGRLLVDAELTLTESGFGQPSCMTNTSQMAAQVTSHVPASGTRASRAAEAALSRAAEMAVIARCQAGDREAFGILLDRYRDRVVNLAFQLLRQRDAAEDVAQEAFTQAFSSIRSFRGESQMFTWLYRITVNLCLQRQRRARPCEPLEEHNEIERANADAQIEDQVVTRMMVEQTLDRLSEPLRMVLILREMHDLSYEEVAAVLRIPVGTVRSRLNEARRKFREAWFQAEMELENGMAASGTAKSQAGK